MRGGQQLPKGMATRLLKSRQRLAILDRHVILTRVTARSNAMEAIRLQQDLRALADATAGSTRASVEAMIGHAAALERKYTEAIAPDEER